MDKKPSTTREDMLRRRRRERVRSDLALLIVQLPLPSDLSRFNVPRNIFESINLAEYGFKGEIRPVTLINRAGKRILYPALFVNNEQGNSSINIFLDNMFFAGVNIIQNYRQRISIIQTDERTITIDEHTRNVYTDLFERANALLQSM